MIPTIEVANLSEGGVPAVVRRAGLTWNQAAVALERATFRLEMPTTTLAVIRSIEYMPTTSDLMNIFFGASLAQPATQVDARFFSGRIRLDSPSTEIPAGVVFTGTAVGGLAANDVVQRIDSTGTRIVDPGWVIGGLSAFDFLEFSRGTVNDAIVMSMEWDEYQLF